MLDSCTGHDLCEELLADLGSLLILSLFLDLNLVDDLLYDSFDSFRLLLGFVNIDRRAALLFFKHWKCFRGSFARLGFHALDLWRLTLVSVS